MRKDVSNEQIRYHFGDERTKSGFLWRPKTIGHERRWLEYATWTEVAVKSYFTDIGITCPLPCLRWVERVWVNN